MKKINTAAIYLLLVPAILLLLQSCSEYKKGMVVCAYPDASQVGIDIIKRGGNAVDAAVAVHFALAVTLPQAGNIGGGGFMVYRAANGDVATLDFREKAPSSAYASMYLDTAGNVKPDESLYSHKAAGVPGSVDGMVEAHKKYGRLKWADVVQPAIMLARKGFKVTTHLANDLNHQQETFKRLNPGKNYFIKSKWSEGDILVQEDLAKTLELIRDKGRAGFYEGRVAMQLVAEMRSGNGLITLTDLNNYHSVWRKPMVGKYKDYKIITMPPPSSGGIALLQLLGSVEKYPLSRWGYNADSTVRLMVEAERRVYADRSKYLGDPDYFKVPADSLLKSVYINKRMQNFSWDHATASSSIQPGKFAGYESDQTTHYSIVDKEGNAVSITTTLNGSFGCKIFVKGAGFLLNNEMDDFSSKPGVPNMYGLIGGKANAIQPGKRMLSSMTPTIVEKQGKLFLVVGTPGGSTIITSVFQTILNVVEFNMPVQQAVSSPRFHHQWLPDEVYNEPGAFSPVVKTVLQQKGYVLKADNSIGRVDAVLINPDGSYEGGADPRGDDTAMGW